ncbi:MAG: HD-GYP domain-containing protein [Deltaproteobacteria bacterium]|nr:HD-GYP domain-containing protein [Deltaproteobacteria bacterium]MBW2539668.1 HD-GYP domain-containing protein [Deltaproteobacteria bacterium]
MNSIDSNVIHRKLLFRISAMGIIIAVLFGIGVWQIEKRDIGQDLLLSAEGGFKYLNNQIRHLFDDPDVLKPSLIQRELANILSERRSNQFGQFVWVGIYNLEGERIALVRDDSYEHIDFVKSITGRAGDHIRKYKDLEFNVIDLDGIPHIQIISPLKNSLNELSAYGETIFAVFSETMDSIRGRAIKSAISCVFIVILTTVLLYPVIVNLLNRVSSLSAKLFEANLEILKVLGCAIAKRDSDTDAHNYRVTIISVKLAETLGIAKENIRRLIKGALLHDVGKIGIEDEILHKPGRLTEDEFSVMKNHVPLGLDIVNTAEWIKEAVDIVKYHHEKYDGSGYANGFKGDRIPETARIFAIADVFDALTSRRPYKEPFSFEKAMDIIRSGRGSHFDPVYLDAFESIASSIFKKYAGREDDRLKSELGTIMKTYFYE